VWSVVCCADVVWCVALIACLAGCGASNSLAELLAGRFFLGVSGCMSFPSSPLFS
jgi:hypothetical protein